MYKIKLRSIGYRLVYEVNDNEIVIFVITVGKRNRGLVYAKAERTPIDISIQIESIVFCHHSFEALIYKSLNASFNLIAYTAKLIHHFIFCATRLCWIIKRPMLLFTIHGYRGASFICISTDCNQ